MGKCGYVTHFFTLKLWITVFIWKQRKKLSIEPWKVCFILIFFYSGEPLIHNISTAYTDLTYLPRLDDLPSAREVSSLLFRQNFANTTGHETRNALFAFFGEFLMFNAMRYIYIYLDINFISIFYWWWYNKTYNFS